MSDHHRPDRACAGGRPGRCPVTGPALFEAHDLVKHFRSRRGVVQAVNGVSLSIPRGRTVGLVGESGSGKSTVARLALRLLEPTSGTLSFDGADLGAASGAALRRLRRRMQIVFQDPNGSLNPRMTVLQAVGEPLVVHRMARGAALADRVVELLERVGLGARDLNRYAHQFSGGQAQRIGIARALATDPDLIVCDEAVSALDVSVQAQVLNLLRGLQAERGLSYLFIAHDLNVVRYMSDEVCVMYLGEIVERGDGDAVLRDPQHPYTRMLVSAVPDMATAGPAQEVTPVGEVPSPIDPPPGCRFHTRCPQAEAGCREERPALRRVVADRDVACLLAGARTSGAVRS